ncbi:unnamed protein product [Gongylonema pulchrum]|uniref:G_PROTEIN_RECEP_F1_2 domain-containing protein n=1 Tax=Gongylonema pulchrum TaxID=637853 RepID=A0A183EIZ4_9BILA|nr:unnamed protein product [Gongylonema pulchrum]
MNVSCVITLIFYIAPMCTRLLIGSIVNATTDDILISYSGISCNFNPLAILAALFIMQDDVKAAVYSSLPRSLHWLIQRQLPTFVSGITVGERPSVASHTTQHKTAATALFSHAPQQTKKTATQWLSKSGITVTVPVRPH